MQGHSSQLAGIFHTKRERFNNTISVNPLKFKIIHLEIKKNKNHYRAMVLNILHMEIFIYKKAWYTLNGNTFNQVLKHALDSFFSSCFVSTTCNTTNIQKNSSNGQQNTIDTNQLKHSTASGHAMSTNIRGPNTCDK